MLTADSSPELPPDDVPKVQARRRVALPQPNIWFAILACAGFLGTMALCSTAATVATLLVSMLTADDPGEQFNSFWQSLFSGKITPLQRRAWVFGLLASHLGTFTLTIFCARLIHGPHWPRLYGLHRPQFWHILLALLLAPALIVLHAAFHDFLSWQTNANRGDANEDVRQWLEPWPRWVVVLIVGIAPGLIEELWCRGFLGRGLLARYGWTAGVALTSTLFGLMHGDWLYAIGTAGMGAALHATYLLSRCLWIPILLHAVNNVVTVLNVIPADRVAVPTPQEPGIAWLTVLCATLLVFAGGWAFWSCRCSTGPPADEPPQRTGVRRPGIVPLLLTIAALMALWFSLQAS